MRDARREDPSFETIVAAGANSAIPHHRPTGAVLAAGDFVKLDFGATVDGYHSDMTRTLVLGPPADWQREIYELVRAGAGRRPRGRRWSGRRGAQVDAAARDLIADAGYGPQFSHGLGHGVGLQIHEAPSLARESASIMAADMCVTVEPGVYLPGRGGVRIEDSGVIRADGYHVLTQTSKDLARTLTGAARGPDLPGRRPAERTTKGTADSTMASTSDFKNGLVLNIDGQLWTITEFQHVKPGKGPAFVRTTLKNVLSGKVVDKTFNAGVKVDTATVDKRDMTYLYKDGADFVFMDGDTYDQISIPAATVGGAADYLLENQQALVAQNNGVVLYVELPASVELVDLAHRPRPAGRPVDRRHEAGARWRPGAEINVPLFLNTGDRSRSTPATAGTSAGSLTSWDTRRDAGHGRPQQVAQARARRAVRGGGPRCRPAGRPRRADGGADRAGPALVGADRRIRRVDRPRASSSTGPDRRRARRAFARLDRSNGCPRWTARSCGSPCTSCCARRRRAAGRGRRRGRGGREAAVHRRLAAVRQRGARRDHHPDAAPRGASTA